MLNLAPVPEGAAELLADRPGWLVVNAHEAAALLGQDADDEAQARAMAARLAGDGGHAVITLGAAGAVLAGPAGTAAVPGFAVNVVDTVGAGDAFVGALAVALATGLEPVEAVRAACAAGAAATTRRGAQDGLPRPADVLTATGFHWPQVR